MATLRSYGINDPEDLERIVAIESAIRKDPRTVNEITRSVAEWANCVSALPDEDKYYPIMGTIEDAIELKPMDEEVTIRFERDQVAAVDRALGDIDV